ncbi:maleylpyruvate isomerase family mycothiol-dependent enzyme [soil metagenome]
MGEYSVAYRGCRERVAELVARLDDVELNRRVPACPDWTVRDLTAHIVGVAADFSVGNLERVGGDEWTGTQIAKRADRSVADLMDEWTELAEQVEPAADLIPPGAAQMLVGDAVTHEHDMRGAIDRAGARDSDAVWIGLDRYIRLFGKRIKDAELPSVVVRAGGREWRAGVREPEAELRADAFDLLRALTGRRTIDEIAALAWTGDASVYTKLFSTYRPASTSLSER